MTTLATAFGPEGPNFSLTRPAADPNASAGADTWFQNCSAAGAKDGTFATADFFNVLIANVRYAVRTASVALNNADDTMIWQAIAAIALTAVGGKVPKLYVASTAPSGANLLDEWYDLATDTQFVWTTDGTTKFWLQVSHGSYGGKVLSGVGSPLGTLGMVGDFYKDTSAVQYYGPKTTSGWGVSRSAM